MDVRAKQRLTGAVIVVALFVLFVPELLTGPKSGADKDGAHEIGAPDSEGERNYTFDPESRVKPADVAAKPVQDAPVVLPPVDPNPMPASADVAAVPAQPAAAPRLPEEPALKPPVIAPQTQTPAPVAHAASAAVKPPAVAGNFVVQLGSFGSRPNAERLVSEMKSKGFSAFIAPITSAGRELYRVRVGPVKDRSSAESLAAQLQRQGQTGSIVPIS